MTKKFCMVLLAMITMIYCTVLPVSAATSSSGKSTQQIIVNTKSAYWYPGSSSITLSQSKGKIGYTKTNFWGQEKGSASVMSYGTWRIQVSALDGSDTYSRSLKGSSIKLNLKPNKTYCITVSYDGTAETLKMINYRNARWTTMPSWKVKSTWKVSNYY